MKDAAVSLFQSSARLFGILAVAVSLMLATPLGADAASGGRAGGSSFGGARAGGFGGGSFGGGSASRSYTPRASGMSPGTHPSRSTVHHHTTVVAPSPAFGFGVSPFGYGAPVGYVGGGSSLFTLIVILIFAYVVFNTFSGSFGAGDDEEYEEAGMEPMSVVTMQVGLLGSARELQRDLNRMGNTVDTSTPQGLHYLLTETVLALRRNPQYAVYGKASLKKVRGLDNCEASFNQKSMEERGKFDRETLSNYGGRTSRSVAKVKGDGMNELIVVTVIAAIDGKVTPTDITDDSSLKENLSLLGSVPADRLLALEVLWTPQDESDYFTKEELITDYPSLNVL